MSKQTFLIIIQRLLDDVKYQKHFDLSTRSQNAINQKLRVAKETPLNKAWVRIIVIFSSVIVLSLLATCIGCIAAGRHGKRRKILKADQPTNTITPAPNDLRSSHASASNHSSDTDVEMLGQLDTIMASHAFHGREWNIYKSEMREKAKRHAKGFAHTSQGIHSPIDVRRLTGKVRALSRSLVQSMTRSEPVQDPLPDLAGLDEILEGLKNKADVARGPEEEPLEITKTCTAEPNDKRTDLPPSSTTSI